MATDILWLSPTDFVTGDESLNINYPSVAPPAVEIKATAPGDLKRIYLGLRVPPGYDIHAIHVCYQLSNSRSFISQIQLVEMQTPDQSVVRHGDSTALLSAAPTCYRSPVVAFQPSGAVLLALRLNFGNIADAITLGAVGVEVLSSRVPVPSYTRGTLPVPGAASGLARVTDSERGIWMDTGSVDYGDGVGDRKQWFNLNAEVNVRDFGAKGDGVTDDLPAFNAAIAALGPANETHLGQTLYVPPGSYYLSNTLHLTRSMILRGASGSGPFGSSILFFDGGITGIAIERLDTYPAQPGRGDWSVITDLSLRARNRLGNSPGIALHARASISNCGIAGFSGAGIEITSNLGGNSNVNNFAVTYCRVETCGSHGIFIDGADANAGYLLGVDCSQNGGWGFYDSSFLGNTYLACHAAANSLGSYKVDDPNARCTFVGCYHEGGQPTPDLGASRSLWLGGLCEPRINTGMALQDGWWNGSYVRAQGKGNTGLWNYVNFGSAAHEGQQAYMRIWNEADPGHSLTMLYNDTDRFYDWYHSGTGHVGWRQPVGGALIGGIRYIPPASMVFPGAFWVGTNKVDFGSAEPSSDTWYTGDRRFNSAPVAGGSEGWICITSGTAGTYAEGRTATADGTATIELSSPSTLLRVGDMLTINGDTNRIIAISGAAVTMSGNITAGTGLAIQYAPPVWRTFGLIN
jgi:hypothetical protein